MAKPTARQTGGRSQRPTRLIVVRAGEIVLFRALQARFGAGDDTLIIYDRRLENRRHGVPSRQLPAQRRHQRERRFPDDGEVLRRRGYYVICPRSAR